MKYLKNLAGLVILLSLCKNAHTQTANFGGWLATFYTIKVNKKVDVIADAQFRSGKQVKNISTILLRPAISFKFNKNVSAALGYAWNDARRDVGTLSELIPEHRIWQHVIVRHKILSASSQHRFRLEQRFLPKVVVRNNQLHSNGYNHAHRFRYFTRTIIPLKKTKQFTQGPFGALQNEVFLNLGNKSAVNKRVFDQNRLYGAVGYRLSPRLDLETGYMNQYMIAANGGIINNHILQLATYLNL
ncbi:MAG: DUF2490 domain-containing protein [Williamsia sp.]|nr:DUF2490 domain-containing protein [Williamsia sp.]